MTGKIQSPGADGESRDSSSSPVIKSRLTPGPVGLHVCMYEVVLPGREV